MIVPLANVAGSVASLTQIRDYRFGSEVHCRTDMNDGPSKNSSAAPLDLGGLPDWLVQRGMQGLPLGEQIAGFCRRVADSGLQ